MHFIKVGLGSWHISGDFAQRDIDPQKLLVPILGSFDGNGLAKWMST